MGERKNGKNMGCLSLQGLLFKWFSDNIKTIACASISSLLATDCGDNSAAERAVDSREVPSDVCCGAATHDQSHFPIRAVGQLLQAALPTKYTAPGPPKVPQISQNAKFPSREGLKWGGQGGVYPC